MKKVQIILGIAAMLFTASCQRKTEIITGGSIPQIKDNVNNMNELVVPVGFTWENSHDVNFNIGITDTRFQDAVHVISIYDANPVAGGNLINVV